MTLDELVFTGRKLTVELNRAADRIHGYNDEHHYLKFVASQFEAKVEEARALSDNVVMIQRLQDSTLLLQTKALSDYATLDERVKQFENIHSLLMDFSNSRTHWEPFFANNRQKCLEIWQYPLYWELEYRKREQIRKEKEEKEFEKNLAEAREKAAKPSRPAPCFVETRKNGLNCNRSDLVELKKFPAYPEGNRKIEISVKKCSQCWQLYKEIFATDEAAKQFQSHFLKPGETDAEFGVCFSTSEAEEEVGRQADFNRLVNPNPETSETAPVNSPPNAGEVNEMKTSGSSPGVNEPAADDSGNQLKEGYTAVKLDVQVSFNINGRTGSVEDWGRSRFETYYFEIPILWLTVEGIVQKRLSAMLQYIEDKEIEKSDAEPNREYYLHKFSVDFPLPEDWKKAENKIIFDEKFLETIIPEPPAAQSKPGSVEASPEPSLPGKWKRVVYKPDHIIGSDFSIVACAEAFLYILDDYGIPFDSRPVLTYNYDETSQRGIFGDQNGPHLQFDIYDGRNGPSDGYSGNLGGMSLRSSGLVDRVTGEKLEISIRAEFLAWSSNQIHIYFEGEFYTVEKLKAAVKPFLGG